MFKHKPVSFKATNIRFVGENSLLKFIIRVCVCKIVFRVVSFLVV